MEIPIYLVIAQWMLLAALCLLVVVMYRQLGMAFNRPKSIEELGPAVGAQAAPVEYTSLGDGSVRRLTPGSGDPILLAFVDATCPSCERLVDSMAEANAAGDLDGFRVLLLVSDPPSYLQISRSFQETPFEIGRLRDRATVVAYKANATPLLIGVDEVGVVRSAGTAVALTEVRAATRACLTTEADMKPFDVVMATPGGEFISGSDDAVSGPTWKER